jgi:hypothetical protein
LARLYAIGVVNVEIDGTERLGDRDWMRAPRHAPEVMAEIDRTFQHTSTAPASARFGEEVYTDTWLWHESGKFRQDLLSNGQQ